MIEKFDETALTFLNLLYSGQIGRLVIYGCETWNLTIPEEAAEF